MSLILRCWSMSTGRHDPTTKVAPELIRGSSSSEDDTQATPPHTTIATHTHTRGLTGNTEGWVHCGRLSPTLSHTTPPTPQHHRHTTVRTPVPTCVRTHAVGFFIIFLHDESLIIDRCISIYKIPIIIVIIISINII